MAGPIAYIQHVCCSLSLECLANSILFRINKISPNLFLFDLFRYLKVETQSNGSTIWGGSTLPFSSRQIHNSKVAICPPIRYSRNLWSKKNKLRKICSQAIRPSELIIYSSWSRIIRSRKGLSKPSPWELSDTQMWGKAVLSTGNSKYFLSFHFIS